MSRRDEIRMSAAERRRFLAEHTTLTCATVGPDGRPHLAPLWYAVDTPDAPDAPDGGAGGVGDNSGEATGATASGDSGAAAVERLVAWTFAKSQKARNLERDPRATVQVEAGSAYGELRGVVLTCDVELERDPERVLAIGLALAAGQAGLPSADGLPEQVRALLTAQAPKRVGLRFVPTRVASWDHRKLPGGAY